jgi:AcrR family transcriptional regulator
LLSAARRKFSERGYERATIRAIASEAGVDPALVLHFFGSKQKLFEQAVGWPFDPSEVGRRLLASSPEAMGERMAALFLDLWDGPETRGPLLAVMRSALTHEESARLLRSFLQSQLVRRLASAINVGEVDLRLELAAAQLIGIAILRHVIHVEPLASAGSDRIINWVAPTLNRYLSPAAEERQQA